MVTNIAQFTRLVAVTAAGLIGIAGRLHAEEQQADAPVRDKIGTAFRSAQQEVAPGDQTSAETYYKGAFTEQTGFLSASTILNSNMQDMLNYFGYPNVAPKDLHRLSSAELMGLGAVGDILATRFFAPKITDVADKPAQHPAGGFGWRKLVRFRSKPGSDADQKGIESLYFLQNQFEADLAVDPFDSNTNFSKFNQAILVRKESPPTAANRAVYFATFGPLVKIDSATNNPAKDANGNFIDEAKLTFNLEATFDEEDRDPETNLPGKQYFVPNACIDCHGRSVARGKLNYLDTDHWFDRVSPQYGVSGSANPIYQSEDFTLLAGSAYGVLYDGGKDSSSQQFANAFNVFRWLNKEIENQNVRAGQPGGGIPFSAQAAHKWNDLHATSNAHIAPYKRGFGAVVWDENNANHRKALYYLNRFCYRCHSSVIYNVFDKEAVLLRFDGFSGSIRDRVLEVNNPSVWMPQDRIFPGLTVDDNHNGVATGDLQEFLELLETIAAEP